MPDDLELGCARCGYDLTGIAASWVASCPVRGICPECGHGFRWADVYDPARNDLPWLIEHTRRAGDFRRRAFATLGRALYPPAYWRAVGVSVRVRLMPVFLLVLAVFGAIHLMCGFNFARANVGSWLVWGNTRTTDAIELWLSGLLNGLIHPVGRFRTAPAGAGPFSVVGWPGVLAFAFLAHAVWPAMFLVLPVTRRVAKLRWAHIARAWVMGLLMLVPAYVIQSALTLGDAFGTWRSPIWSSWYSEPAILVWPVFLIVSWWWWAAIRVGWRIERGGRVFGLLWLVSLAVPVLVSVAIDLDFFAWIFVRTW